MPLEVGQTVIKRQAIYSKCIIMGDVLFKGRLTLNERQSVFSQTCLDRLVEWDSSSLTGGMQSRLSLETQKQFCVSSFGAE